MSLLFYAGNSAPWGNLQSGRICKEVKIGNPGEYIASWAFITHQKQHGGKTDHHRVHTEWQLPLSGVHSSMMEILALAGESAGGCMPTRFHYFYHHVQSCGIRSSWEGRYTPPFSTLPLYVLCGDHIFWFCVADALQFVVYNIKTKLAIDASSYKNKEKAICLPVEKSFLPRIQYCIFYYELFCSTDSNLRFEGPLNIFCTKELEKCIDNENEKLL